MLADPPRQPLLERDLDARPLALFRIALGLLVLSDWLDRLGDLHAFYTDLGVVPHDYAAVRRFGHFSLFDLARTPLAVELLFAVGIAATIAFLLGYRTRLATFTTWLLVASVQERNLFICDSSDTMVRLLLFWSLFLDLGAVWSLDSLRGRRPPGQRVPAWAVLVLRLQVALVYAVAFLAKSGGHWWRGQALAYILQLPDFARGLAPLLLRSPLLCRVLTLTTLAIEGSFAPLVLLPLRSRVPRAVALVAGLALHASIFLTMKVDMFSLVMPISYLVFVDGRWLDALGRRVPAGLRARLVEALGLWRRPPTVGTVGPAPPRFPVLLPIAAALFLAVVVNSGHALFRDGRSLRPLRPLLGLTGLWQDFRVFSPNAPAGAGTWSAEGQLADGRPIDVLGEAAPYIGSSTGFLFHRWYKYRHHLGRDDHELLPFLGAYLCRRYNTDHPQNRLVRFDLRFHAHYLRPPDGSPVPPDESWVVYRQPCLATSAPRSDDNLSH